jgi:hypothetical protein
MSLQGPALASRVRSLIVGRSLRRPCILLSTVLAVTPASAHCFHIWHYPKPQKCFTALAPQRVSMLPPERTVPKQERIEIALPSLEFVPCQEGDDYLQGIAKLRQLYDAR